MTKQRLDRRRFLELAGITTLGTLAGCRRPVATPSAPQVDFSAAFFTDPHVFEGKGSERGFQMAVEHALAQSRPPELAVTGGDLVFDILEKNAGEADELFEIFDRVTSGVGIPMHHTFGNHDLLGVYEASGMSEGDELYGKVYPAKRFGLERLYQSFDHEGWHFVILDTVEIDGRGYRGMVDAEQLEWLEDDLAAANKPTVVFGHIPLFSNFIEWRRGTEEGIPGGVSVVNSHEVAAVLERHPVKLSLSGHLHINERFLYKGIEFANVGAVSGNWWNGLRDGFEEGYVVLDFVGEDVSWRYVDYGWEAVEA